MNEKLIQRRATVTWEEDVRADPLPGENLGVKLGTRTMSCPIEIEINLDWIIRGMGRRAATNKTGKSVDGNVKVKRAGKPTEVSRQMKPGHDQRAEDESNYQQMIGESLKNHL